MKIAIPSNDGVTISAHFGRSKGFIIAEINDNQVISKNYLYNDFTHHSHAHHNHNDINAHHHSHEHHNHNDSDAHHHSHDGVFEALKDCEAVISRGMGRLLYDELVSNNKTIFITNINDVDESLMEFIKGNLDNNPENCCTH